MQFVPGILCALSAIAALSACSGPSGSNPRAPSDIDQSSVCVYDSAETAKRCKDGQLSFFRPDSWGNEQFPLIVAASYCDFNHAVMHTKGGVVCVFTTQRTNRKKATE